MRSPSEDGSFSESCIRILSALCSGPHLNHDTNLLWGFVFLLSISGCAPEKTRTASLEVESKPVIATAEANESVPSDVMPKSSGGGNLKFREASQEWGLEFIRFDDIQGQNRIMEVNGGGVALFDYDQDGLLDVFLTQGGKLPLKKFEQELSNELFRNCLAPNQVNGAGEVSKTPADVNPSTVKVTQAAGLVSTGFHTGCAVGDVDSDGFPDLYVTAYGVSTLWLNAGDGTFRDVTRASRAEVDSWSSSTAFADLNQDGFLDLYVSTYVDAKDDPPMICPAPKSPTGTIQCPPTLFRALPDVLLLNDGEGGFVDATQECGVTAPDGKGLAVAILDVDGDGKQDIYVANDGVPSFLYLNSTPSGTTTVLPGTAVPKPRFLERGMEFGLALNGEGRASAAMGIAQGDYDRDGWTDFYVTNFYLEVHTLYHSQSGQGFVDASSTSRVGPPSRETLAFGTSFLDVDHDGWLDLLVATGHIADATWNNQPYRMFPHLFHNDRNGKFTDVAQSAGSYFTTKSVGRGLAVGDLDRDGDLDVVVSQQADPSVLLLNETPAIGTSVIIKPIGRGSSNRDCIGARLTAVNESPPLYQLIAGGCSFQSASAREFHLALPAGNAFESLRLDWPDGTSDQWKNVTAGYYVALQGGKLIQLR